MKTDRLPPGQHEIDHILRWDIDHPGITPRNLQVDLKTWTLTISGEVQNPKKLTWQDILALPAAESTSDFHCVEGWSVRDCKWHGVKFATIIQLAKPNQNARYILVKCADGFSTSFSLQELTRDDMLLAYRLNDKLLEQPLGGPLRLVVPQKYAYKSAMWIEHIIFTDTKELGFWEKRGYSDTADVWGDDRYAK